MNNPENNDLQCIRKIWCGPTIEMIDYNTINGPGNKATILTVNEQTLIPSVAGHGHKPGNPTATLTLSYVVAS